MAQAGVYEVSADQVFSQENSFLCDLEQPVGQLFCTRLDTLMLKIAGVDPSLESVDRVIRRRVAVQYANAGQVLQPQRFDNCDIGT